jgi:hypothetical protein
VPSARTLSVCVPAVSTALVNSPTWLPLTAEYRSIVVSAPPSMETPARPCHGAVETNSFACVPLNRTEYELLAVAV